MFDFTKNCKKLEHIWAGYKNGPNMVLRVDKKVQQILILEKRYHKKNIYNFSKCLALKTTEHFYSNIVTLSKKE